MSAKNCFVVVYKTKNDTSPFMVQCPKDKFFSKKDAQRLASAYVKTIGVDHAEIVEFVASVQK